MILVSEANSMLRQLPDEVRTEFASDVERLRFMVAVGILQKSAGYNSIFWPQLTVCDDCVTVAGRMAGNFEGWLVAYDGNRRAIEAEVNRLYTGSLFFDPPCSDEVEWLEGFIRRVWLLKLTRDFPERHFDIQIGRYKDDLRMSSITFVQVDTTTEVLNAGHNEPHVISAAEQ